MTDAEFLDQVERFAITGQGVLNIPRTAALQLSGLAQRTWFMVDIVPGTNFIQVNQTELIGLVQTARINLIAKVTATLLR